MPPRGPGEILAVRLKGADRRGMADVVRRAQFEAGVRHREEARVCRRLELARLPCRLFVFQGGLRVVDEQQTGGVENGVCV